MKSVFQPLALTLVLAASGFSAFAAGPTEGGPNMGAGMAMQNGTSHHGMNRMDPAKMQARMDKHHEQLKAKLKVTAAQETAWTTYVAAMKPPASMMTRSSEWADIAKLPTPERIDKMKTLRNQRMTEMIATMDKHGDATKALYVTLTPEQQKVFDAQSMGRHARDGHMGSMHSDKY